MPDPKVEAADLKKRQSKFGLSLWGINFFLEDLRRIVQDDYPRVRPQCSAKECETIDTLLKQIESFCKGGDPPIPEWPESVSDPTPDQLLLTDVQQFCKVLAGEWCHLDLSDRSRLRAHLNRVVSPRDKVELPKSDRRIHWDEAAVAACAIAAWTVLFAIGYSVHAKPFEDVIKEPVAGLNSGDEIWAFCGALFMFIISSIPTNVLLLSCIAGGLGTAYRRSTGNNQMSKSQDYIFSMTASFFIFIILIVGRVRYKDETHPGEQPAIVADSIWQRTQALLERNRRTGGADVRNKFGAILKGLIRCKACDCAMVPSHTKQPPLSVFISVFDVNGSQRRTVDQFQSRWSAMLSPISTQHERCPIKRRCAVRRRRSAGLIHANQATYLALA